MFPLVLLLSLIVIFYAFILFRTATASLNASCGPLILPPRNTQHSKHTRRVDTNTSIKMMNTTVSLVTAELHLPLMDAVVVQEIAKVDSDYVKAISFANYREQQAILAQDRAVENALQKNKNRKEKLVI